jgi:hypothetical protein
VKIVAYILLITHYILLLWALGGVWELSSTDVFWPRYSNPEFPFWVLLIHWGSVLFASISFLYGYFMRLSNTPQIMTLAYGLMAVVCIIETFGYMTSKTKYLAMGAEFTAYVVILLLLFKQPFFINHFSKK